MKKCVLMAVLAVVLLLATNASAQIPGTSIVRGYVTDWWTGKPIEGSLVRVIDESSGAEVGNCTTDADGFYAIRVWFPSVGMTMTANITASKEGYHTNYTITTLTGSLPPEVKIINFTLKEILTPTPTLSFEPLTQNVVPNEAKTMNLTLSEVPGGLSGYNITVRLSNGSVAEIISVDFPGWASLPRNSTLPADAVWLKAADLTDQIKRNATDVILATLTIRGDEIGNTEIIADINKMDDDDGNPICPSVRNGNFTVREKIVPTVSIEPASTKVCPGDAFSVNVTVDPAGKGVSGAEVKIAFNAAVVECEDVSPGNLLGERPIEGRKVIDNINGTIWYKLARIGDTPVPTEEGTFAILSFRVKEDAPEGTYYLKISSAKLADENFTYISPIEIKKGTFTIVFEEGLHITITTDKTEYTTGDIMLANITIANPTEETKHVIFNWWVTVPSKRFYTAPLATMPMTLPPAYNTTFTYPITVGYWGAENFGAVFCVALTNQTSGKIISFDATFWNYEARGAREAGEKSIESIVSEIKRDSYRRALR